MSLHTSDTTISAWVSKHVSAHTCTQLQVTFYHSTCDIKGPRVAAQTLEISMGSCIPAPCTTVGRDDSPLHASLSPPLLREWVYALQQSSPDQYGRPGALPVSLPDGSSQSLECLESLLLISLSCHIPGLSLHSLSLPWFLLSLLRLFCFFPLFRSVPLSLAACNPGAWQAGQATASASTSLAAWQWGTSVTGCNQTCLETEQEEREGGGGRWRECKWGGGPLLLPD